MDQTDVTSDAAKSPSNRENTPEATNQTTLPGNVSSSEQQTTAVEEVPEILMEGVTPHNPATISRSSMSNIGNTGHNSSSGYLYNTVLSSAIILFIALVLRRVFLLESDVSEELDDVLL